MKICKNCHEIYNDKVETCSQCGGKLSKYEEPKADIVYASRVFKYMPVFMAIAFIISGIVCGFVFKITSEPSLYSYHTDEKFNTGLMFMVWLSGVIPTIITYAVYAHFRNQETQIEATEEVIRKLDTIISKNVSHPTNTQQLN